MITAQEAKALYDASGAEANTYMTYELEPKVKKAAEEGDRCVFVYVDAIEVWQHIVVKPIHKQVMDKLAKLGYRVQFAKYGAPYVPRALADDDGEGPKYENYGFCIHW